MVLTPEILKIWYAIRENISLEGAVRALVRILISSATLPELYLSAKADAILLKIANGGNPPLSLKAVTVHQQDQPLIVYLEKGQQYALLFGDKKAVAPDYDLKYFGDSLKHELKQLVHAEITGNPLYKTPAGQVKSKEIPASVIWIAIVFVLAVLSFLTFKMTREVNKRTS